MRIIMVGQRGIPASYGGVEKVVEALSQEIVEQGHDVTVCTQNPGMDSYNKVNLAAVRTVRNKHLTNLVPSLHGTILAIRGKYDVVHYHAMGPCLFSPLARVAGLKVVATIHGRDDLRAKWGLVAKSILRLAAWLSVRVPHATIAVSQDVRDSINEDFHAQSIYIPNGVSVEAAESDELPANVVIPPDGYFLAVGRLVPEKRFDLLIKAFKRTSVRQHLVIAGGSSFTDEYAGELKQLAQDDDRIQLLGAVYGEQMVNLRKRAAASILPSKVEGLPMSLLEGIADGLPVIVSDIPPHLEIVGPESVAGKRVFREGDEADLARQIELVASSLETERSAAKGHVDDVLARYSWSKVASETIAVYQRILARQPAHD